MKLLFPLFLFARKGFDTASLHLTVQFLFLLFVRKGFDTASLLDRAIAENKKKNKQQQKDEDTLESEK